MTSQNKMQNGRECSTEDIKTMKLYCHVARIYNELAELGNSREGPFKLEDISQFDQYHYYGTMSIDDAIHQLGVKSEDTVLDIGSGLGGPARHIAHATGCHVTAIELQPDLNFTARDLTVKCGLQDRISHVCGDFLEMHLSGVRNYDYIIAVFSFQHIRNKPLLLKRCWDCLKPGGKIYIDELFESGTLTPDEIQSVKDDFYVENLPTDSQYIKFIQDAGFTVIQWEDVSVTYADFCSQRLATHQASRDRYVRVHNEQVYREQEHFFKAGSRLWTGGHLGGCKCVAEKNAS